jgi:cytoskeletal protein CcmA (bactofilin family)
MWGQRRPRGRDDSTVFIGQGSEIEGSCRFPGLAIVEGRITGDHVTAKHLVVGEGGAVTGVVRATVVTVKGTITGTIVASERVELLATARVTGDIEAPALAIEAGAVLDGRCHSIRESAPPALLPHTG